jgi:uncharacterized protein (DUF2249 family)
MTLTTYGTRIDLRAIAPRERHPLVFSAFRSLGANESMELVNDHDPAPLHGQFEARDPGGFRWEDVQRGPDVWRVRITKLGAAHGQGTCCGGCGGA